MYDPYQELKELDYEAYRKAVIKAQGIIHNMALESPELKLSLSAQAKIERMVVGVALDAVKEKIT